VKEEKEVLYKDVGDSLLVKLLGRSPKLRIIDIFLTNQFFDFSREELVKELGMSKQTLYKNFKDLEKMGIVRVSREIGRATMYRLNKDNPMVKCLDEIVRSASLQIAGREAEKFGVEPIQKLNA